MNSRKPVRLFPLPAEEVSGGVYRDFGETLRGVRYPDDRPYTVINMVSTIDGKTTIGGRAGDIGGKADREAMKNLRAWSDAVMIGAGTLRAEKLSLGVPEHLQALRRSRGKNKQPLAVILTSTGDLPIESNLLGSNTDNTLVLLPENVPQTPEQATKEKLTPTKNGVNLEEALKLLKSKYGVTNLLVEGGPRLNHSLLKRSLADQLLLTISSKILGGEGPTIVEGQPLSDGVHRSKTLASVHLAEDTIFLRYLLR